MRESTLPLPTKPDALDGERWLMATLLEMSLEGGAEPWLAVLTALIFCTRRGVSRRHSGMSRPGGGHLKSLPPETLQVCQETLGRPLAREELEWAFRMYRGQLSLGDQVMHSKIIKAILPRLPLLKDTGATRLGEVLEDSRH